MKTVTQVVNETIEHYKTNPRSVSDEGCLYNGPGGAVCAFALWVKEEERPKLMENNSSLNNLRRLGHEILKDSVSHIVNEGFWFDLQKLHDDTRFWTPNKQGGQDLSPQGRIEKLNLITDYEN